MYNTATNEQDQHAIKAEERRRRVSSMMTTTSNHTDIAASSLNKHHQQPNEKQRRGDNTVPSVHGTAVAIKHHDGPSSAPRRTKEGQLSLVSEKAAAAMSSPPLQVTAPASLTDMEIKASARQGHVSATAKTPTGPRSTVPGATPVAHGALRTLEAKASTRQGHMTRLLSQPDGATQLHTIANEEDGKQPSTATTTTQRGPVTLLELHQDAKQQPGPAGIPDPPSRSRKEHQQLLQYQEHPATSTTKTTATDQDKDTTTLHEIRAEIVDEQHDREKIVQEAQADLIAKAVVASSVAAADDNNDKLYTFLYLKQTLCGWILCGAMAVLVVLGVILGGVCGGAGLCSAKPSTVDPVARAQDIAALINTVTLRDTPIAMLSRETRNATTTTVSASGDEILAEEEAILFLIENDVLQLHPDKDEERLIQRYALAVLWFSNGPWTDTLSIQGEEVVNGNPLHNWFVGADECLWTGVMCVEGEVKEIDLPAKGMVGTLPADLTLLTGLQSLVLNENVITGEIPSFLTRFTSLERLDLNQNRLNGTAIPTFLTELTSLKEYDVRLNSLSGAIPDSLASMTQLEILQLGNNDMVGTVPEFLADFSLHTLHIGYNVFTGTIPSRLFQMTDLESLNISSENFSGIYNFADLQGLSKLTDLSVSQLAFEGSLEDEMVDWWPNMKNLYMIRCGLKGTLPASFAAWSNLHTIDLANNELTGTLPAEALAAWSNLSVFAPSFNDFEGTLPTEIGLWTALTSFDIRHNMITGTLPTEVGIMTNLIQFLITDNQFTGMIPDEVLNFNEAFTWLDMNNFSGVAPYCANSQVVVRHRVDCALVDCDCCGGC